jgi:hypothetical protein
MLEETGWVACDKTISTLPRSTQSVAWTDRATRRLATLRGELGTILA